MGMQNIFSGFLLGIDNDKKKDFVSISIISWCLSLFGPENINKPWNYYKDFCTFLQRKDRRVHQFLLKDARFDTLSKSFATMCFHWNDFNVFLRTNEYITNKLACLVRDALCLEYIKVVVAVISVIGFQLIASYHAMAISNKSTQSSLKSFFENLYEELCNHQVDETFFSLTSPAFKSVSDKLFKEVQKNYGLDVVKAVKEMAESHMNDCMTLAQIMLPHLGEILR